MASQNNLSVPPELLAQIEAAAHAANKTTDEWAAEAMKKQLEDNHWQNLLKRNERYGNASGIKEEEVPDQVHQYRRERTR